jgi:hypothetical protein
MRRIASGIAFGLIFMLAACIDGIVDEYGMAVLCIVGGAVCLVSLALVWYAERPEGGRR